MIAKITSVNISKGKSPHVWSFEYRHAGADGQTLFGSVTADEAKTVAGAEIGAIHEMCCAIQHTPSSEYTWLLGRVFKRASCSDAIVDRIADAP